MQDVTRADLSRHTTLRLGGVAGCLTTVFHQDEFVQTVREMGASRPFLLLAGGSNVVIADAGFPGTVVLVRTSGVRIADVEADGGVVPVPCGPSGCTVRYRFRLFEAAQALQSRAWAFADQVLLQSPRTWNPVGGADDDELAELIAHEVTHALMYQLMQPGDDPSWAVEEPPLWFREGMASVTAGQGHRRPPPAAACGG